MTCRQVQLERGRLRSFSLESAQLGHSLVHIASRLSDTILL
jgi:hypothetical protein